MADYQGAISAFFTTNNLFPLLQSVWTSKVHVYLLFYVALTLKENIMPPPKKKSLLCYFFSFPHMGEWNWLRYMSTKYRLLNCTPVMTQTSPSDELDISDLTHYQRLFYSPELTCILFPQGVQISRKGFYTRWAKEAVFASCPYYTPIKHVHSWLDGLSTTMLNKECSCFDLFAYPILFWKKSIGEIGLWAFFSDPSFIHRNLLR